jgi:hypothetical protein
MQAREVSAEEERVRRFMQALHLGRSFFPAPIYCVWDVYISDRMIGLAIRGLRM